MISKEKKAAVMAEFARTPGDTGSPEVQVAILTERIKELTEHLKTHHKRSSFQTWYVKAGWSETWSSGLPEENRYRKISCADRKSWYQKVSRLREGRIYPPFFKVVMYIHHT